MNALRIAYLRQGVNYLSNIARKRAYTNTTVQALNLTVVFQCPPDLVGLFLLSKAPKRAMLKAGEHLMDNAKGNNHKEGDKP